MARYVEVTDPAELTSLNTGVPDVEQQAPEPMGPPVPQGLRPQAAPKLKPVQDPTTLGGLEFGLDFSQPVEVVREKVRGLPPKQREKALQLWADAYVKKEREEGKIGPVSEGARAVARGSFFGEGLDELTAAARAPIATARAAWSGIEDPQALEYYEGLAYQRARDRAFDNEAGLGSTALQFAGGLAGGVGSYRAAQRGGQGVISTITGGPMPRPAATRWGRVGQGAGYGGLYGGMQGGLGSEGGPENRAIGTAAGGLAGLVTGGVLSGAIEGGDAVVRRYQTSRANRGANGAYGSIIDDIPDNDVDRFISRVTAGSAGSNAPNNRRATLYLGEELDRLGGNPTRQNLQQATDRAAQRIAAEDGVAIGTARDQINAARAVHADSPLWLGEASAIEESNLAQRGPGGGLRRPATLAQPENLDAVSRVDYTGPQATIDYLANKGGSQASTDMAAALARRQPQLEYRMRETWDDLPNRPQYTDPQTGATRPMGIEDVQSAIDDVQRLANADYTAAHNVPLSNQGNRIMMHWLPRILDQVQNQIYGRAGEYRDALQRGLDQFYLNVPGTGRVAMQTLRQLQDARTALRGQMTGYTAQGRGDLARAVQPLYTAITRLMERMSPEWARANARWADGHLQEMAQELGDAFQKKAGPQFREQLARFQQLDPRAQDIVRTQWLQQQLDILDNLGDDHVISKFYRNNQARNAVRQLFGDEAAVRFAQAVRDQKVAEQTSGAVKNSMTAKRQEARRAKEADEGLGSAVETGNVRQILRAMYDWHRNRLLEQRNRAMVPILSTPLSDTANLGRHLVNLQRQQRRLEALRNRRLPTYSTPTGIIAGTETGNSLEQRPRRADGGAVMASDVSNAAPAASGHWTSQPRDSFGRWIAA